jgi:UDP-N-acetyl-D-mannosaminuronic acid dehydrogenase
LKASVVGLGYVGIPLAAVLADRGYNVVGVQRRSPRSGWKINWLNKGRSPIKGEEPLLTKLIHKTVRNGKLRVVDDYSEIKDSNIIVITVQTPLNSEKKPDLANLKDVCHKIGEKLSVNALVCLESTVPPGTTEKFVKPIIEKTSGLTVGNEFNLVYCYERVTPGRLIENLLTLPRVIGGVTESCTDRGIEFYRSICDASLFKTDPLVAEVSKLVENSHRDVNIAFANEAACICRELGVDFHKVRKMVNTLPYREGEGNPYRNILDPGAGVGGHCLPKDPIFLLHALSEKKNSYDPRLIPAGREINDSMPEIMFSLIKEALGESKKKIQESKIGILGLSYKENTGDTRNSPTLRLIDKLNAPVKVHDPYVQNHSVVKPQPLIDTILGSDCLVVMTKHNQYRELDLRCIGSMMKTRIIVDGRNLFDPEECIDHGFIYRGIGHVTY